MQSFSYIVQPLFIDFGHEMRKRRISSKESDWPSVGKLARGGRQKMFKGPFSEHKLLPSMALFFCPELFTRSAPLDGPALSSSFMALPMFFVVSSGFVSNSWTAPNWEECIVSTFQLGLPSVWFTLRTCSARKEAEGHSRRSLDSTCFRTSGASHFSHFGELSFQRRFLSIRP